MRPISSFLCDQFVDLTYNTWASDSDGSRVVASTRTRYEVPAAVLPGPGQTRTLIDDATGDRRVTEFTPITVQFAGDVGLSVHDLVVWADDTEAQHTYVVIAYGQPAGQAGDWVATCEERV